MSDRKEHISEPDQELQVRILRVLYSAYNRELGGVSGKELRNSLEVITVLQLEKPLLRLNDKGYVDAVYDLGVFVITDKGMNYLEDLGNDWYHGSFVPRRPLPILGEGEIALPLPKPESDVA